MNRLTSNRRGAAPAVTLTLALLAGLAGSPGARAAQPLPVALAEGSSLKLEGKSNVHAYHSVAGKLDFALTADAPVTTVAALDSLIRAGGVKALDLTIPVAQMHSGKDGLDKNMQKALKAEANPSITFHLTRYTAVQFPAGGDSLDVRATGKLAVAGVERDVELPAVARRSANTIELTGMKPLLMTDFGVKPPTLMMGALRTEDGVVIHYRLLLGFQAPAGTVQKEGAR